MNGIGVLAIVFGWFVCFTTPPERASALTAFLFPVAAGLLIVFLTLRGS